MYHTVHYNDKRRRVGRDKPTPCKTSRMAGAFCTHFDLKTVEILLRLSKTTKSDSSTCAVKAKLKLQLKVLFIFIEMRLSKKLIKRDNGHLLWNQNQKDSQKFFSFPWIETLAFKKDNKNDTWKFFSSSLKCDFQKKSFKETIDSCSETKPKNESWTSFSFPLKWGFQKSD